MHSRTVLLVDDDASLRAALQRALRHERYRVVGAASAADALAMLRRCPIDVIVCDYVMPGMLGTELLRKIRSEFRDIVPVLLTGHGSIDVAQCAVNDGGAFRLLSKPCHPEALARAIHEALELRVYRDRVRGLLHEIDATLPAWSMASDACGANADAVLFEVADEPVDLQQLAAELGEESAHEA